jgi:hypothetical protein
MNALKIARELANAEQTCADIAFYLHCWDEYGEGPYGPPTTKDEARLTRAMVERDKLAERLEKIEERA